MSIVFGNLNKHRTKVSLGTLTHDGFLQTESQKALMERAVQDMLDRREAQEKCRCADVALFGCHCGARKRLEGEILALVIEDGVAKLRFVVPNDGSRVAFVVKE